MPLCKMIGGCLDGLPYNLPDGKKHVIVQRPPQHMGQDTEFHDYFVLQVAAEDRWVAICVGIYDEMPNNNNTKSEVDYGKRHGRTVNR